MEVLVIPLQETVQWRVQSKETNGDSSTEKDKADSGTVDEKLTEDGEAAKAILEGIHSHAYTSDTFYDNIFSFIAHIR